VTRKSTSFRVRVLVLYYPRLTIRPPLPPLGQLPPQRYHDAMLRPSIESILFSGTHDNTCTYTRGAPKILRIAVVALQNTSNSFPRREVWMDRGRPPPAPCEVRGKMFEGGRGYVKMTMNSRPPSVRTLYPIPYTVTQRPSRTLTLSKM
jgi:hypothetical protein